MLDLWTAEAVVCFLECVCKVRLWRTVITIRALWEANAVQSLLYALNVGEIYREDLRVTAPKYRQEMCADS